ncbi:MAG: prepilin-type N-terminal cleavage/methylation domain-containing protein [Psychrobacter sp.]|nr:prepilin-type N-terminal cleavage/methylation domain-containing protein [Psychrobacter sp.]
MKTSERQRGFTLLELMIAMAIFAALAVLGWQVFDSVNRARERAQRHADDLAVLQYAYLQLQQDIGQIIAYQAPSALNASNLETSNNSANTAPSSTNQQANKPNIATPEPFMTLDSEQVSFVRFSDPDPRYQTSPSLQRVEYIFSDQQLIRRQYPSMDEASIGLDSVVLEGAIEGRWQAYLPQLSNNFPNKDVQNDTSNSSAFTQANGLAVDTSKIILLPNGVSVSFSYKEMPITWQFALAPQAVANSSKPDNNTSNSNNGSNSNNNSSGNSSSQNQPTVQ